MTVEEIRDELRSKWRSAVETSCSGSEWRAIGLTVPAPVRLLAGIREPDGNPALLLEVPLSVAPRTLLRTHQSAVSLSDQRRQEEGVMRLAVTLEKPDSAEVFEVLASDLANVASMASSASASLSAVVRRLEAWQACLRLRAQKLSREEQIGLFGELMVLRAVADVVGYARAISVWQGPYDGLHDFVGSGVAVEVKTALGAGHQLRVSKFDQLETDGLSDLIIVRPRLREAPDGQTILDLAGILREQMSSSAEARSEFDECLIRVGVREGDATLDLLRMQVQSNAYYRVTDGFPRLTLASVPAGIIDGSYLIDERALSAYEVPVSELLAAARLMSEATTP